MKFEVPAEFTQDSLNACQENIAVHLGEKKMTYKLLRDSFWQNDIKEKEQYDKPHDTCQKVRKLCESSIENREKHERQDENKTVEREVKPGKQILVLETNGQQNADISWKDTTKSKRKNISDWQT